jgi:hypothetical protein
MRRLLGNLAALAAGMAFSLLVAEAGLRLAGFHPSFVIPDRTIGSRWRPGARYRWTLEGYSDGRINAAGWRDRDYAEHKPEGTTRILFCGDSYVAALEVPLDSTFHKRLERDLDAEAMPGRRFEVMAIGRGGLGTAQEYLAYRKWGAPYDPDVVALVFVLNDWADNWAPMWQGILRPYFLAEDDSLRLDTSFVDTPEFRGTERTAPWKSASSLVTLAAQLRGEMRARLHPDSAEAGLTGDRGWYGVWNFDVSPPADSIPAFALTARILERFAREVQSEGRRFVVFATGAAEIEAPELLARRAGDPTFDRDKAERWLIAEGRRAGFEVVPLSPWFRAAAAPGVGLWNRHGVVGYGHWNSAGHAVAAEAMRRYFESRLGNELRGAPRPASDAVTEPAPRAPAAVKSERPRPVSR